MNLLADDYSFRIYVHEDVVNPLVNHAMNVEIFDGKKPGGPRQKAGRRKKTWGWEQRHG